jgi:hypothetical protein
MRRLALLTGIICLLAVPASSARAQRVTVQQPTFETFGVGTSVSVPDRGRASLGGVRRSAAARSSRGPIRAGTNIGLSNQATSTGVSVYVQDLAEMDQQVLAQAERSRAARNAATDSQAADRAYATLQSESRQRDQADRRSEAFRPHALAGTPVITDAAANADH